MAVQRVAEPRHGGDEGGEVVKLVCPTVSKPTPANPSRVRPDRMPDPDFPLVTGGNRRSRRLLRSHNGKLGTGPRFGPLTTTAFWP